MEELADLVGILVICIHASAILSAFSVVGRRLWSKARHIAWIALIISGFLHLLLLYWNSISADLLLTISYVLITVERHSSLIDSQWHEKHFTGRKLTLAFTAFFILYGIFVAAVYSLDATVFKDVAFEDVSDIAKSVAIAAIFTLNLLVIATHLRIFFYARGFRKLHPLQRGPYAFRQNPSDRQVTDQRHCQDRLEWWRQRKNRRNLKTSYHFFLALTPSAFFIASVQLLKIVLIALPSDNSVHDIGAAEIFLTLRCISSLFPLYHLAIYFTRNSKYLSAFLNGEISL